MSDQMVEHHGGNGLEVLASVGHGYVQIPKPVLNIRGLFQEPVDHHDSLRLVAVSQRINQTFELNLVF